jgi:hypothetical protein
VYTRSLVEHSTEATEHDIAWLDRLIETERQKQTTSRSDTALTIASGATDKTGATDTTDNMDLGEPRSGNAVSSTSPSGAS